MNVTENRTHLLLVPGALLLVAGVWLPVGWVTVVEAVHVRVSVCAHQLKASC